MLHGIGGNKLDEDSELRDVRPDELAALVRQKIWPVSSLHPERRTDDSETKSTPDYHTGSRSLPET
jgi:hypothetical protein